MTRLIISAASEADFPQNGLPEIAMVGRSNVGKSTLINALVREKIARTSAAPGKTRLANYYLVEGGPAGPNARLYLVDLPGYGYARGGTDSVESFERLTRVYFDPSTRGRRRLAGILQLIDSRHPDLDQDARSYQWLLAAEAPVAIVATKIDKLKQAELARMQRLLREDYDTAILPVSTLDGRGLDEVWKLLREWTRD
jgi:GTP-binding protein